MSRSPTSPELTRAQEVLSVAFDAEPERWLLVSTAAQRLWLRVGGLMDLELVVSTAAAGLDAREGSGGTPGGLHVIARKVGAGQPRGTCFVSRRPTGRIWSPDENSGAGEPTTEDLILSRVLVLDGLEPGVNHGPGIDSRERFIYLHGTNHEADLGRTASGGCIRLANDDIITLFERVEEGDPLGIL